MSKQYILHVGYTLTDKDINSKLEPFIGNKVDDLRSDPSVAFMFYRKQGQSDMKMWYDNKKNKPHVIGYMKQLYVTPKFIVASVVIEGRYEYITLMTSGKAKLLDVKYLANRGELGKPIELSSQIPVEFTPYCEVKE